MSITWREIVVVQTYKFVHFVQHLFRVVGWQVQPPNTDFTQPWNIRVNSRQRAAACPDVVEPHFRADLSYMRSDISAYSRSGRKYEAYMKSFETVINHCAAHPGHPQLGP